MPGAKFQTSNLTSSSNNLMWRSHLYADPPNAPLFYGPFAVDPILYTDRILEGFDAWMGVGQILTAPQLFEGGLTRDVYFPKSSPDDQSLDYDLHPPFRTHKAGDWATVATPIEHGGLFAREGAVIPVGKEKATVMALSGPARTHADGVDVVLESEGGQVGVDDWRGVMLSRAVTARRTPASGSRMTESPLSRQRASSRYRTTAWKTRSMSRLPMSRLTRITTGLSRFGPVSSTSYFPSATRRRCVRPGRRRGRTGTPGCLICRVDTTVAASITERANATLDNERLDQDTD